MGQLWPTRYLREGSIAGRLLTGYVNLEVSLLHCVQMSMGGQFDAVLKKMFSKRGEFKRIEKAAALGGPACAAHSLKGHFDQAIRCMHYCLKIRNQYAHWVWWDDNSGKLAFANLEQLAKRKRKVPDLDKLKVHHIDGALLAKQEKYFSDVDDLFSWINFESRVRDGRLSMNPFGKKPPVPRRPRLRLP